MHGRVSGGPGRPATIVVAGLGLAATALVSLVPAWGFGYRGAMAHVAIETAASLIACLVAYLVYWRAIQEPSLPRLLLLGGLTVLALTNLALSTAPAVSGAASSDFQIWATLLGRALAGVLFAAAAFVPQRRIANARGWARRALLAGASGVAVVALLAAALSGADTGIDPSATPASTDAPQLVGTPIVVGIELVIALFFAAAAFGFARVDRQGDPLAPWLALGSVLAACAWLNYFLFPSIYTDWVYTGDAFRLLFFLVLALGAAYEIAGSQRTAARAEILEERRRLARDLHDGLAQELAYIVVRTQRLVDLPGTQRDVEELRRAAGRALGESRAAISALRAPVDVPLDEALARAAEEVARTAGIRLRLDLAHSVEASTDTTDVLRRLVSEAVGNAARHADAQVITLVLRNADGVQLRIEDDGAGFDPSAPTPPGRHGLQGMRERVDALGGTMRVSSRHGEGTTIEVWVP